MPRTRKDEAPLLVDTPVIPGRCAELDGHLVSTTVLAAKLAIAGGAR